VPEVEAAGLSETDPGAIQILGPETRLLLGDAVQTDRVGSAELRVTFGAFVQAHRGQAAAIERMLVEECRGFGDAPRVLELFAGSGAFGIALGGAGATVDAVESFAPGARLIADAARARALPVRAHAEDAGAFVRSATDRRARWDLVLVDPPRRGLSPDLREALAALAPRAVAYVSCSPETLARDLAHLSRLGLAARALAALDMMPQTDEVECVAWMEPSAPAPPRVVLDGPGFSIVELQPHEPVPLPAVSAPPPGGSGLAALRTSGAAAPEITSWTALALVKGVAHKRGTIRGRTHHVRLAVGSGHSLVRVSGAGAPAQAAADLASVGHPVLGDPKRTDEATRRHFFDKRGLDRAAWHTIEIVLGRHGAVRSKLAADLAAVLAGLGIDPPA
jgi:23S rRNA (uracil1939-C5)-methyltransferase